jgi:hypothetical protein
MLPKMDLDHLMFADHWEMCQGPVGGDCGVVGEGQGAGTIYGILFGLCKELHERSKAMCWGCANSK